MKSLMTYACDKGSVVINGICFSNGIGDGMYDVFFNDDMKPIDIKEIAWIDLRDCHVVNIWESDCNAASARPFTSADFDNAQAIGLGFSNDGDLYIWKLF